MHVPPAHTGAGPTANAKPAKIITSATPPNTPAPATSVATQANRAPTRRSQNTRQIEADRHRQPHPLLRPGPQAQPNAPPPSPAYHDEGGFASARRGQFPTSASRPFRRGAAPMKPSPPRYVARASARIHSSARLRSVVRATATGADSRPFGHSNRGLTRSAASTIQGPRAEIGLLVSALAQAVARLVGPSNLGRSRCAHVVDAGRDVPLGARHDIHPPVGDAVRRLRNDRRTAANPLARAAGCSYGPRESGVAIESSPVARSLTG